MGNGFLYIFQIFLMPTSESSIERKGGARSHLQKGPIDLPQLPRVVRVQGRQPAGVGQLGGQEDDRLQAHLEDREANLDDEQE